MDDVRVTKLEVDIDLAKKTTSLVWVEGLVVSAQMVLLQHTLLTISVALQTLNEHN